jgi:hypothetical protein
MATRGFTRPRPFTGLKRQAKAITSTFHIRVSAFSAAWNFKRANAMGLPQKRRMITKNIGMLLLAIYLILVGITVLFHVAIPAIVTGILALIAGI